MSAACEAYSISADQLGDFVSDQDAAWAFVMQHYGHDTAGDGFEAVWLDKSAMGILEAFAILSGGAEPPASWVLGADNVIPTGDDVCPYLDPEQTEAIARWISTVSDEHFADRAASNTIDNDVEYLSSMFSALRGFYARAAEQRRAVLVYFSG
jgi:hypothetical protein